MQLNIPHLNLTQIAESGQCFRWKADNDAYVIPSFGPDCKEFAPLTISGCDGTFTLSCSKSDWEKHWKHYFDMGTDYDEVARRIISSKDAHAIEAYNAGSGIRILRQDTWEMIITFLISQNNNIKRITKSVEEICKRHAASDFKEPAFFPRPEEFDTDILTDRTLGLGYRAPYIDSTVNAIKKSPSILDELNSMDYDSAYDTLIRFTGIGPKVANCICLFGLHHIEAFPIDTHVKQLLVKYYPDGFPYKYYEGMAGIIQQYLFYYELKN